MLSTFYKRLYISSILTATLFLFGCSQKQEKPYNVLFIISDDLTATAVSSYENKACNTPNIDKLASEGVLFTKAYCQYPACGPSRSSIMTGYYPSATPFEYLRDRESIGPDRKTWPQAFKDNGYYTARVSKIYHMDIPRDIEKGSDGDDDPASWNEAYNSQAAEWQAKGEAELVQNNPNGTVEREGGNVMTIVKADGDDLVHADGKTAKTACELIKKHKDEKFFLAIGMVRPHVPFVAPKAHFDPYPYENINLPEKVENDWNDIPERGINFVTSLEAEMSVEQQKKAVAAYYASVSFMDEQVGKILKTLKEEGLEDNTIVIFTSDHGFHLDEHDFWMKVSLHEESVRVPLIIKIPGKKPAVCNSFTELIDLYPTITELAGIKHPEYIQGKSIVKAFDDPNYKVRDTIFSASQDGRSFLLRTDKWAYIQYDEDAKSGQELYDMKNDPKQYTNLAHTPEHAKRVDEFQQKLKEKLKEIRTNDLNSL